MLVSDSVEGGCSMDKDKTELNDTDLESVVGGENLPPEHFGLKICRICGDVYRIGENHKCFHGYCPYCDQPFRSRMLYELHLQGIHNAGPLVE